MPKTPTDKKLIAELNRILTGELTAVNQYFLHAKMCENWGYTRLFKKVYAESIDEMRHAEQLIERILYLGGHPNVQRMDPIQIGETVPEQLAADQNVEETAIPRLNSAIALCVELGDNGTRALLEAMLVSEEEHLDWIEAQLELIDQVGVQNYLAQQIHPA